MAKLSLPEIKQQLDKLYTFDKGSNTGKSFCVFFDCQSRFQSQTFLIFLQLPQFQKISNGNKHFLQTTTKFKQTLSSSHKIILLMVKVTLLFFSLENIFYSSFVDIGFFLVGFPLFVKFMTSSNRNCALNSLKALANFARDGCSILSILVSLCCLTTFCGLDMICRTRFF